VENNKIIHQELTYRINGILFNVFNELGPGLKERTYERATSIGFTNANIKHQTQVYAPIKFQDKKVGSYYYDFYIENKIILELKVGDYFNKRNIGQLSQYLKEENLQLGILANFTTHGVKIKRVVNII
jgi:GxxExxY protein